MTATVISERRRRWLVCPPYPDGISHGQKKAGDGKAVFLSPACLNSAGNGSSFFYFSNGGDVVAGECAVPLSLDGVNYTEPRQMVSITQAAA